MKNNIKTIVLILAVCISGIHLNAQQVNSLYFLDNVPVRHYLNPAFQPTSNFYLGLPILGYSQFGFGNNALTIQNTLSPTTHRVDKDRFYNSLKPTSLMSTDIQLNLLDFGFRTGAGYWSFSLTEKIDAQMGLPKDFFKFAFYGTPDTVNVNSFNLGSMNMSMNMYTEAALGYSRVLNDKWTVGMKIKGLFGVANTSARFDNLTFNASIDEWTMQGNGVANISTPAQIQIADKFESVDTNIDTLDPLQFLKPSGLGAAFDFGGTYKPIEALTISAAITDLGMIRWYKNTNNVNMTTDFKFDGLGDFTASDFDNSNVGQDAVDSLLSKFKNSTDFDITNTKYNYTLSPKINIGAEYGFFDNTLTLGLLSRTMIQKKAVYEEITGSVNIRPINWFNAALSYSVMNGRFSNIGAGIGLRVGIIHGFISADYIPLNSTKLPLSVLGVSDNDRQGTPIPANISLPYNTSRMNLAFGFNIVIGNKQDKDKDGVKNRKDLCPNTPKGVVVDLNGCPVDTDGDGVADYLDKCPDTPVAAYNFIDENGCPKDTDGDGVFDYIDDCPNTPAEAINLVDKHGCSLDSDGDGVPDYLDKCPDTPAQAKGMVDNSGCPLDSDGDGVADYLDLCPDTPVEAQSSIDKNGCPIDSDDDGVADYLDKCPDTPAAARGMVDEKGCPRDTDGDGIPDYLDNCPKLFGVAANKGCPEIKKEVRTLFQKALRGIQFESGKSIIKKSSFMILDQIAQVLAENPDYNIEVQGHTDNVGKDEMNLELSEKRAEAVRDYMINKGISDKKMIAKGYGVTLPIAPNTSADGRARNRRVEFVISFEEVKLETVE